MGSLRSSFAVAFPAVQFEAAGRYFAAAGRAAVHGRVVNLGVVGGLNPRCRFGAAVGGMAVVGPGQPVVWGMEAVGVVGPVLGWDAVRAAARGGRGAAVVLGTALARMVFGHKGNVFLPRSKVSRGAVCRVYFSRLDLFCHCPAGGGFGRVQDW